MALVVKARQLLETCLDVYDEHLSYGDVYDMIKAPLPVPAQ